MELKPLPGFNWTRVSWGGPDEPVSDICSYCDKLIPEEAVPLILWNQAGWVAKFCDDCQVKEWGIRPQPPEEDCE